MTGFEDVVLTIWEHLARPFGSDLLFGIAIMLGVGAILLRQGFLIFVIGEFSLIALLTVAGVLPRWMSIVLALLLALGLGSAISRRWGA